jgi:hypothetical protein
MQFTVLEQLRRLRSYLNSYWCLILSVKMLPYEHFKIR